MNIFTRSAFLIRTIGINQDIQRNPDSFDPGHKETLLSQIKKMQNNPRGTIEIQALAYSALSVAYQAEGRMDLAADAAMKGVNFLQNAHAESKTAKSVLGFLFYMSAYGVALSQDISILSQEKKNAIREFMNHAKALAQNDETKSMVMGGIAMVEFLMNDHPERVAPALFESVALSGDKQLERERGEGFGKRLEAVIPESWKQYTRGFETTMHMAPPNVTADSPSI